MLKKENRLSKRKDFEEIRKKGTVRQSPSFGLASLKKDDGERKIGFIISKKISKKAVERNRIKRLLAEIVRKNMEKIEKGSRMVFLVKQKILGKSQKELEEEFKKNGK